MATKDFSYKNQRTKNPTHIPGARQHGEEAERPGTAGLQVGCPPARLGVRPLGTPGSAQAGLLPALSVGSVVSGPD